MDALKTRLEITENGQDNLLNALLEDSKEIIEELTWRSYREEFENLRLQLAAFLYARQGAEGELSHQEGDVSRSFEAFPEALQRRIRSLRVGKA